MVNQKQDPFPSSDSTPIHPPIFSTIVRQIASPSPVPGLAESSLTNRSNTFCFWDSGKPHPVSAT